MYLPVTKIIHRIKLVDDFKLVKQLMKKKKRVYKVILSFLSRFLKKEKREIIKYQKFGLDVKQGNLIKNIRNDFHCQQKILK